MSRKSEETVMVSGFPQKAYLQTVLSMLNRLQNPRPATQFLFFHSSKYKFIVVDCKQGQLHCPRQARKFRKKLKEDSKLYEVYKTNV